MSLVANPEDLEILTTAVVKSCQARGIDPTSLEGRGIGQVALRLFERGLRTTPELEAELTERFSGSKSGRSRPHGT